jgi:hypothetical protein
MNLKQKLAQIALDKMVAENERLGLYHNPEYVDSVNMSEKHVHESDKSIMEPREDELKECVHEFFTKYLNYVEETDSGRPFNPVTIGCCRSLMLEPLNKLLDRMRELSGAEPNPLYEEKKHEG